MLLALLFVRTAIGLFAGVLTWLLVVRFGPFSETVLPYAAPALAGLVGGLTCTSLSPSQGLRIAATCGTIFTLVTMLPMSSGDAMHVWSLLLIPGYLAGALGWLMLARWIQRRAG